MGVTSTNDATSIFKDGKLKPGIYKIQNIVGQTYVDIREHTKELCGRPATVLEGKGLWEILPSGPGYTLRRLEPGMPEQFCVIHPGSERGQVVSVSPFPMAWRIEIAHEDHYRGCEYVRFFWSTTNITWDLADYGSDKDRTQIHFTNDDSFEPCRIWKLVPVRLDTGSQLVPEATSIPTPGSGLPPYDGNPGNQRCTCSHQTTEMNDDGFGTTVVETTTTTSTVTTRKKYRVEGD